MYRLLIETLLGVNLEGDQLQLNPRLPKSWTTYKIHYRYRQTIYHITITRLADGFGEPNQLFLDGKALGMKTVPLVDDRREHFVKLKVWSPVDRTIRFSLRPRHTSPKEVFAKQSKI